MTRFLLLLLSLFVVDGFSLAQRFLRRIWREHPPVDNPFVALIETPLHRPGIAYTANDHSRIYLDSQQLEEAPNTMWNVLRHELAHTQGQEHGFNTTEMRYAVTLDARGQVVDDSFRI